MYQNYFPNELTLEDKGEGPILSYKGVGVACGINFKERFRGQL